MPTLSAADATALFRAPPHAHLDGAHGQAALRTVGRGPDVLFVHGWPVSGATWRHLLPHLAPHFTCHVLDLPGAGDSRWGADTPLSIDNHIRSVRAAVDALGLESVAVVGHDSGGLIARHALAGDPRLRGLGLINTEQPQGLSLRFRLFLLSRHLPGIGRMLAWALGRPRLRRLPGLLGGSFVDPALLDGDFDAFFLRPLREDARKRRATLRLLDSFDVASVRALADLHARVRAPVSLVWGAQDPFFPVRWAREMVDDFDRATLTVLPDAALFAHEERPAEVAAALRPALS